MASARVTYQQVMADPDNLALNFQYARERVEAGELQPAAAALERLLLLRPEWDAVRLFYAVVLYRLDDRDGALREFNILENRELSAAQAGEVAHYLARLKYKTQPTRISGSLSVGARYDTNRNLESDSGLALIANTLVTTSRNRKDDFAGFSRLTARVDHDLGNPRGDTVFAAMTAYINEQIDLNSQDFQQLSLRTGAVVRSSEWTFTPYATGAGLFVDNDFSLAQAGGGVKLSRILTPSTTLFAGASAAYADYDNTTPVVLGRDKTGVVVDAYGAVMVRLGERNRLRLSAGYMARNSHDSSFSYDGVHVRLADLAFLGSGQYILAEGHFWGVWYRDPDPRFSTTIKRRDLRYKVRLAYGVPLSTIARWLAAADIGAAGPVNLQLSASYYAQDSTLLNFDSDGFGFDIQFTRRFAF